MSHLHRTSLLLLSLLVLCLSVSAAPALSPADLLIDLHTHTSLSDGSDSPLELIQKAHARGVKVLAITDHDQLQYDEKAIAEGERLGMQIIRGTELSCEWTFHYPQVTKSIGEGGVPLSKPHLQSKVHLLGYFTHSTPISALSRLLDELRPRRTQRNGIILKKLKEKFGIEITPEMVVEAGSREVAEKKKTTDGGATAEVIVAPSPPLPKPIGELGTVVHVTAASFQKEVLDASDELIIVEFFAPWCGQNTTRT